MSDSNQRKSGAVLSYVSIIVNTLIQLLYTPLLIRMLGQSEYGLYSLVASIIGYLTVLDLGFGNAIIVFTAKYREQGKYEEEKKLHGMFKIVYFGIGIVAGLIGLILFFNVDNMFGNTMNSIELSKMRIMMLILTFNLSITFLFSIYSSIINAYEKFVFQKVMSIINTILKPLLMIPFLFLGYKSITMCSIITVVNMIILSSNYAYCKNNLNINIKYRGFDNSVFKMILGYSFWIFLGVIVDKINWSLDQFILGAVSGTIDVSIYSVASQLNILFINLSTAISGVLLPKVSKMVANNSSSEELTDELIKVSRIQWMVVFFMVSSLILFGKQFLISWVGTDYKESYYVALWLIIPMSIPLLQNLGISIRQAKNKQKFASLLLLGTALINGIMSYFLAQKYGAIGSAFGTGATLILNTIIINFYYQKVIDLNMIKFWKVIIKMTFILIIPFVPIFIFIKFVEITGILRIGICGLIYALLYSFVTYCLVMNNYEKNNMLKLLKILKIIKE